MGEDNMDVTLYSSGCPKCKVLIKKMDSKNIKYSVVTDIDLMISEGITSLPVLEVDGERMDFMSAVRWVNGVNV